MSFDSSDDTVQLSKVKKNNSLRVIKKPKDDKNDDVYVDRSDLYKPTNPYKNIVVDKIYTDIKSYDGYEILKNRIRTGRFPAIGDMFCPPNNDNVINDNKIPHIAKKNNTLRSDRKNHNTIHDIDKKTESVMDNIMYVDAKNIDLKRIIVQLGQPKVTHEGQPKVTHEGQPKVTHEGQPKVTHEGRPISNLNVQFYKTAYFYNDNISNDPLDQDSQKSSLIKPLIDPLLNNMVILCKDVALSQNRRGAHVYQKKTCNLPLNKKLGMFDELEDKIRTIRSLVIDFILKQNVPNLDNNYADELREKRVNIEMMRKGKLCKIIKLGSKSENNINTKIETIDQFNELMADPKFNKYNSDFYYKADIFIAFRCCVYSPKYNNTDTIDTINKNNDMRISFTPYIKLMIMRYNKASCVTIIDTADKIIADNVLVL
jgi:hypothetical protein